MKNTLMFLLVSLLLSFSLTACGGGQNGMDGQANSQGGVQTDGQYGQDSTGSTTGGTNGTANGSINSFDNNGVPDSNNGYTGSGSGITGSNNSTGTNNSGTTSGSASGNGTGGVMGDAGRMARDAVNDVAGAADRALNG